MFKNVFSSCTKVLLRIPLRKYYYPVISSFFQPKYKGFYTFTNSKFQKNGGILCGYKRNTFLSP